MVFLWIISLDSILDILLDIYQYLLGTNCRLSPVLDAIVDSEDLKRQALYPGWIYNILEEYKNIYTKSDIEVLRCWEVLRSLENGNISYWYISFYSSCCPNIFLIMEVNI